MPEPLCADQVEEFVDFLFEEDALSVDRKAEKEWEAEMLAAE